jgi:glycosyltransferase involved in cell wall biosynthesis
MICHSHPEITIGGAEIAAYQLYKSLSAHQAVSAAWYLGCDRAAGADKPGVVFAQPFGDDREYIYATDRFEWFKFANRDQRFPAAFRRLLTELRPNVVHVHHYLNFGVEIFLLIRQVLPEARILLTLHEYLSICHHYGQMVTKEHHNLCYQSSPAACHKCFPEISKADFFLRKLYIQRFFGLVDTFIAPSRHLRDHYVDWGLPPEKMVVLENMMPHVDRGIIPTLPPAPLRLGFFGQISVLKGMDVLFEAVALLEEELRQQVSFEIYGDYRGQPPEFQERFLRQLEKAGPNIHFHGPYDRQRVDQLMQSVHAVLVPSVWWENSPIVIQEALRNRRPVICSDIGGTKEKVRNGVDGFHFAAGSAMALAALVRRLVQNPETLVKLTDALPGEPEFVSNVEDFLAVYRGPAPTAEAANLFLQIDG